MGLFSCVVLSLLYKSNAASTTQQINAGSCGPHDRRVPGSNPPSQLDVQKVGEWSLWVSGACVCVGGHPPLQQKHSHLNVKVIEICEGLWDVVVLGGVGAARFLYQGEQCCVVLWVQFSRRYHQRQHRVCCHLLREATMSHFFCLQVSACAFSLPQDQSTSYV